MFSFFGKINKTRIIICTDWNWSNVLLLNMLTFDFLYCALVMPHNAAIFIRNGLPFTENHCKYLGFLTMSIIYGERFALASIALNATNVLRLIPDIQHGRRLGAKGTKLTF